MPTKLNIPLKGKPCGKTRHYRCRAYGRGPLHTDYTIRAPDTLFPCVEFSCNIGVY